VTGVLKMDIKPYRKFIWSGLILLLILLIGTAGYLIIGDGQYSFINALYMTVITITTIGFTEVFDFSNNPAGRVFTMFIAISGVGVVGYAATNLTVLLVEGQLTNSFKRRHMENIAKNSKGHYIVCGAGITGLHIVEELISTKRGLIVIDTDKNRLEKLSNLYKNVVYIEGNPTDNETQIKAGINQAIGLFAVFGDDNMNLVISLTAKQLNPQIRVVAECQEVSNGDKMKKVGVDSIVSPSYIGGLRMASEMIRPTVVSFLDIMLRDKDKNLRVEEIPVPEHFIEKKLVDTGLKMLTHSLLIAIKIKGDWIYNPADSHIVKAGNIMVFMTTPEGRVEMENKLKLNS
jgi:voltage-gated potassium channel